MDKEEGLLKDRFGFKALPDGDNLLTLAIYLYRWTIVDFLTITFQTCKLIHF